MCSARQIKSVHLFLSVRQAGEETLNDLFKRLPLHKLVRIGCKRDDILYDIHDRLKHGSGWLVGVSGHGVTWARSACASP
jgi:hypothetical protein